MEKKNEEKDIKKMLREQSNIKKRNTHIIEALKVTDVNVNIDTYTKELKALI